jgi:hypothetical protein
VSKFRKKPVVIEARQWLDGNGFQIVSWINTEGGSAELHSLSRPPSYISIETLEGAMRANHGDWIIKGVQGEFYPCKPDIFEATYEAVQETTNG